MTKGKTDDQGRKMKNLHESLWLNPFIILLISSHLFGCYSWKQTHKPIEEVVAEKPESIRVEKTDSSLVELYNTFIVNDSLKGYLFSGSSPTSESVKYFSKISINEIQNIYIRGLNPFTTALLISGVVIIIMMGYVAGAVGGFLWSTTTWD